MKTKESFTLPDSNALRDFESQFRQAQKEHPDLFLERFVDGGYLVRGTGRGRFRLLAARAARAAGHFGAEDACQSWIEILIQYLLEQEDNPEYLKVEPAAIYVNPEKTSVPLSELIDTPWDKAGATIGNTYTINHLFRASADCCLWLISRAGEASLVMDSIAPNEECGWEDIEISFISDERVKGMSGFLLKTEF